MVNYSRGCGIECIGRTTDCNSVVWRIIGFATAHLIGWQLFTRRLGIKLICINLVVTALACVDHFFGAESGISCAESHFSSVDSSSRSMCPCELFIGSINLEKVILGVLEVRQHVSLFLAELPRHRGDNSGRRLLPRGNGSRPDFAGHRAALHFFTRCGPSVSQLSAVSVRRA